MAFHIRPSYTWTCIGGLVLAFIAYPGFPAMILQAEPVLACVIPRHELLTPLNRARLSHCLAWENDSQMPTCHGAYKPLLVSPLTEADGVQIRADNVSFFAEGRSRLSGHVSVHQNQRIISAQTAYVYRDLKKKQVTKVELLGEVRLIEPGKLMIARKATVNPHDQSGKVEDVLYRLNMSLDRGRSAAVVLPAWGRATFVERFANKDYLLRQATYSTCPPESETWHIEASEIKLDNADTSGVARNAVLKVGQWPVLYTPYLTFPTSNARKSGLLMPLYGYSNIGGFDAAIPYYWNIAPNYDATITPHVYTRRGLMMGGDFRYLTAHSLGSFSGHILPQDHAFREFLSENQLQFPQLRDTSSDRWSVVFRDTTLLARNLTANVHFEQVSDDYYLQDFSSNLAILTENQLLRQGDVVYTTDHWLYRGMVQSYQTLHPVNQAPIADAYERLPQLLAQGNYNELPMGATLDILAQFDHFNWTAGEYNTTPQGPRYHLNPVLSLPEMTPWGYLTPSISVVENYYDVRYGSQFQNNPQLQYNSLFENGFQVQGQSLQHSQSFNRAIPRYNVDSGLTFEREWGASIQTLEPRLDYLYVPYHNQTAVPVYESGYMIFNTDQLFRTNRFSGFDRIGDTNQLSYALTSRWISDQTGQERASVTLGQIRYFSDRRVQLCYQKEGGICEDNPLMLGYLSPTSGTSPIASHGAFHFNSALLMTGDYVWDSATKATNNGNLNLHYQPADNQVATIGYTYLVNGNLLPTAHGLIQDYSLHQVTLAYATPITDRWSGLGVYSYNISKGYSMMNLLGVQYDNCCWAARLMGGRTFMSLDSTTFNPQYNNNVYLQVLLKGLGTVSSNDPSSIVDSYLPGLRGIF